jgi:two-component system sensor histidine kinase/response regulator
MHRILIIEDDDATRRMTAKALRFEGFEVLEAANGKLGVATAVSSVPDLIVCDIMMPDMDGFGVLQALRDNPPTALTPFIFVTAMVASRDLRNGMEAGADDYLTKPYKMDALLGSVRRRLEKRSRQIEEGARRAEEMSLAVAASIPQETMEALDRISAITTLMALKCSAQDPQILAMHQAVAGESIRLRRMMRRLHIYSQLPQLYANRFALIRNGSVLATGAVLERVARGVCRSWKREEDLVILSQPAHLPLGEEYFELIVEELVDNACKFSAPGAPVEVKGQGQRELWSLTVSNRGTGMSCDQIARIGAFKQFWSGNEKPRGLGLGLALTQGVARLHGAEFAIESGADAITVSVLIPLETQGAPTYD